MKHDNELIAKFMGIVPKKGSWGNMGSYQENELEELNEIIGVLPKEEIRMLNSDLQQRDKTIKELLAIVDFYHDKQVRYTDIPYKNWNDVIEKARKLIEPI